MLSWGRLSTHLLGS